MKTPKNLIKKALIKTTSYENVKTICLHSGKIFRVFYPDLTDCVYASLGINDEKQEYLIIYNCKSLEKEYEKRLSILLPEMVIICLF